MDPGVDVMTRDLWLRRLSASLFALSLLLLVTALPAVNQQQSPSMGIPFLAYAVVGWLVTRNRPRNPVGWVSAELSSPGATRCRTSPSSRR